ncbi:hypothetical protein SORBI_3001G507550, partial [Sorghum bicolor]
MAEKATPPQLKLFNSMTRRKEPFQPASSRKEPFQPAVDGKVTMYVCGVTPYDFCHMGNGRAFVVFDVLY